MRITSLKIMRINALMHAFSTIYLIRHADLLVDPLFDLPLDVWYTYRLPLPLYPAASSPLLLNDILSLPVSKKLTYFYCFGQ
jgi:hypothetical protein